MILSTAKGRSILIGSVSCSSGEEGSFGSVPGVLWRRSSAMWTSPSLSVRESSGCRLQPIRASRSCTRMVGLCHCSEPIRPPARTEPVTSRASRCWPSGSRRATRCSVLASESSRPAHHQNVPSAVTMTSTSASSSQPRPRSRRRPAERRGGPPEGDGADEDEDEGEGTCAAPDEDAVMSADPFT